MNALANSQKNELGKFLKSGFPNGQGPVTFERYTGQESDEEREAIIANPPDILLTNYVMLELLLTRPRERRLIEAASGLRYLVFDELHTYRGRQGADVALSIRRVRTATGSRPAPVHRDVRDAGGVWHARRAAGTGRRGRDVHLRSHGRTQWRHRRDAAPRHAPTAPRRRRVA